jgi:hypothetical protein
MVSGSAKGAVTVSGGQCDVRRGRDSEGVIWTRKVALLSSRARSRTCIS